MGKGAASEQRNFKRLTILLTELFEATGAAGVALLERTS